LVIITTFLLAQLTITTIQNSFADTENNNFESITMEGYFNTLVIDYQNGTTTEEYYLFVDSYGKNEIIPYKIEYQDATASLREYSGHNVKITGYLEYSNEHAYTSPLAGSEEMYVESITILEQSQMEQSSQTATNQQAPRPIPNLLKTVPILSKYASTPELEPHDKAFFENKFFDPNDSLAAYFNSHSYGSLTVEGKVVDWQQLPKDPLEYAPFGNLAGFAFAVLPDVLNLADESIDFDGPDNIIQNSSPDNWRLAGDSDDVDELPLIFNGQIQCTNCAFAFVAPIQVSTDEGRLYVGLSFYSAQGFAFSVERGYGVPVHELGHTFGWSHTNSGGWSIMNPSVSLTQTEPPGIIAHQKMLPGWIPSGEIITILPNPETTITLDVLSAPSPDPDNHLVGIVPLDATASFYTLEMRKDSFFDDTPSNKVRLLIHEASSPSSDTANFIAELDVGNTFRDEANNIEITHTSATDTTATVTVQQGGLTITGHVTIVPLSKSLTEQVDITDTVTSAITFTKSLTDQVDITDTVTSGIAFTKSLTEQVDITDTVTSAITFTKSLTEQVDITDTVTSGIDFTKSLTEQVDITDLSTTATSFTIDVMTDSPVYVIGQTLTVFGTVNPVFASQPVTMSFTNPNDVLFVISQTNPLADGTYSQRFVLSSPLWGELGTYIVNVSYHTASASTTFDIGSLTEKQITGHVTITAP